MNIAKLTFTIVVAAASQAALFAGGLVNGGFENPDTLAGWSTETGPGGIETVGGAGVSPFAAPGGVSNKAVLLADTEGPNGRPILSQDFSIAGPTRLSFDFKLSAFSTDHWRVLPAYRDGGPGSPTGNLLNILIGADESFKLLAGQQVVQGINLDSWYRVVVDMDFATQRLSGSLTEFGGAPTTWADVGFIQSLPGINTIAIDDAVWTSAANGDLYLDNVSVSGVNSAAVPEPATYGIAAVAVLLALAVRRVCGRNRR